MPGKNSQNSPGRSFNATSSIAVIIGIVVGIGIFRLPPIVAANSANELQFILFWIVGGVISLTGALCYCELSSQMPDSGGEYRFLREAFGSATGFFLSWGRMTVIQTGSIVLISFILADFATLVFDLGNYSQSIYAAAVVIILTGLNISGTTYSRNIQNILSAIIVLTLIILIVPAFLLPGIGLESIFAPDNFSLTLFRSGAPGAAMIFVLLTYGGWSEAAYLTGELYDVKRNIVRSLVGGIVLITALYVCVNLAYLQIFGLNTLANSTTVGFDLAAVIFGERGSLIVALIIIVSAISTANATILTGARTNYALGRDFKLFGFMGKWNSKRNTPVFALIVQGVISLILVVAGSFSEAAISTIVDYTAPVFWFFITLVTFSLFIFRRRKLSVAGRFRVPLYPITPILFLSATLYMLYSSLVFTGFGALYGVLILFAGIPVYILAVKVQKNQTV